MSMDVFVPADRAAVDSTAALPDREIVARVRGGETALFEILMRRHNQRLYRAARAVIRDELEVEDILQQAYLNAFVHLDQFEGRSELSTWLTRIVLNEAFARRRTLQRPELRGATEDGENGRPTAMDTVAAAQPTPDHQAYASELHRLVETAVDSLPETYRVVIMLRDIEGLSTSETGLGLGLGEEAVKTRLHRARAMVRRALTDRLGSVAPGAFHFHASRCDRVVAAVFALLVQRASDASDRPSCGLDTRGH
jgi:RNA polymerase sigma-70 factor (ECF subfamily)